MAFFLARITGGLIGLVLALIAFFLQGRLRKKEPTSIIPKVISFIGAAGSVYLAFTVIQYLCSGISGASSVLTTYVPLLVYAVAVLIQFIVLILNTKVKGNGLLITIDLVLVVVVAIQLILSGYNLISHFSNLLSGLLAFLYIQVAGVVFVAINVFLFLRSYLKGKKAQ